MQGVAAESPVAPDLAVRKCAAQREALHCDRAASQEICCLLQCQDGRCRRDGRPGSSARDCQRRKRDGIHGPPRAARSQPESFSDAASSSLLNAENVRRLGRGGAGVAPGMLHALSHVSSGSPAHDGLRASSISWSVVEFMAPPCLERSHPRELRARAPRRPLRFALASSSESAARAASGARISDHTPLARRRGYGYVEREESSWRSSWVREVPKTPRVEYGDDSLPHSATVRPPLLVQEGGAP